MAKAARELEKRQSGLKTTTAWTQQMLGNVTSSSAASTPPMHAQASGGGGAQMPPSSHQGQHSGVGSLVAGQSGRPHEGKDNCFNNEHKKGVIYYYYYYYCIPPPPLEMDSSLREEMDSCIEEAFLTGSDEAFSQMMYLIMSENVSPDYQVRQGLWAGNEDDSDDNDSDNNEGRVFNQA